VGLELSVGEKYRKYRNKFVESVLGDELEEARTEAQNRLKEQTALREASTAITSSLDLKDVLYKICEQLCLVADATSAYIVNLDIELKKAEVVAEYISDQACEAEQESDLGAVYDVIDTRYLSAMEAGEPWVDRIDDPDLPGKDRRHLVEYGAKSVVYVPMKVGSRIRGVAEVWESRRNRDFTMNEIALCRSLTQNAAITLENARLYEQTKQEIAERSQVEAELRQSEERYSLASKGANDGLWDWDLDNDQIFYSPRWKEILGYSEDEIKTSLQEWFARIHPGDLVEVQLALSAHLEGVSDHFEHEYRIRHQNGSYLWVLTRGLAVRDTNGTAYRMAGSQTDITLRKRAEEKLSHDALHDSLTGLPNRALFFDRLERIIEHTKRNKDYLFAVLFLDIDRFKNVNDRFGHLVGDNLLIAIGERLRSSTRLSDTVSRLGGDEFVVLVEDIENMDEAIRISARIQETIRQQFDIDGHEIFTSCSVGIIINNDMYSSAGEFLRDADIAMYRAKSEGRSRHVVFDSEMRTDLMNRIWMEHDLRQAIAEEQFRLHYQPILSLRTGRLVGFEALIRWQHPSEGLISPMLFVPLAEETRLIIPIGRWVIKEACQQLKQWEKKYPGEKPLTMSVNISSVQLNYQDFVDQVEEIITESDIDPANLTFEITERMIVEDNLIATRVISRLRELGVRVHLDDFGTGYSALSYLQRYPIDILKIDRAFIGKLNENGENVEIIKAILNLARDLNMSVIAEGIETEYQFDLLKELNCRFGQGYFFAKPMDPEGIEVMLATNAFFAFGNNSGLEVDQYRGSEKGT
jgi:diguanylate cyclase (GGDEF)-like protein/PAS domain S-box-containing protein